jgi:hypothetical protein
MLTNPSPIIYQNIEQILREREGTPVSKKDKGGLLGPRKKEENRDDMTNAINRVANYVEKIRKARGELNG